MITFLFSLNTWGGQSIGYCTWSDDRVGSRWPISKLWPHNRLVPGRSVTLLTSPALMFFNIPPMWPFKYRIYDVEKSNSTGVMSQYVFVLEMARIVRSHSHGSPFSLWHNSSKRYLELASHSMVDSQYGQDSLRYFFFHGNHGGIPIPPYMSVDAKIVVFNGEGQM